MTPATLRLLAASERDRQRLADNLAVMSRDEREAFSVLIFDVDLTDFQTAVAKDKETAELMRALAKTAYLEGLVTMIARKEGNS